MATEESLKDLQAGTRHSHKFTRADMDALSLTETHAQFAGQPHLVDALVDTGSPADQETKQPIPPSKRQPQQRKRIPRTPRSAAAAHVAVNDKKAYHESLGKFTAHFETAGEDSGSLNMPSLGIIPDIDADAYETSDFECGNQDVINTGVIVLGDSSVGKTTMMRHFAKGIAPIIDAKSKTVQKNTVGMDFIVVSVRHENHGIVKVLGYDTAGQERFRSLNRSYYRNAHAAIIMFDMMNRTSFESVSYWLRELNEHANEHAVILVGNKADKMSETKLSLLPCEGGVTPGEALACATQWHVPYAQISSVRGYEEVMYPMAKVLDMALSNEAVRDRMGTSPLFPERTKEDQPTSNGNCIC